MEKLSINVAQLKMFNLENQSDPKLNSNILHLELSRSLKKSKYIYLP